MKKANKLVEGLAPKAPQQSDQGSVVQVSFPEEKYSPVQYNSFSLGPYSITTVVRPGETAEQCMERAMESLRSFAEKEFKRKCREHLRRVRAAQKMASE